MCVCRTYVCTEKVMHKRFQTLVSIQTCVHCIGLYPLGIADTFFIAPRKKANAIVIKYMAYHIDYVEQIALYGYRTK